MRRAQTQWFVIAPLLACTVDNDNGDPFGSGTAPSTTVFPMTTTVDPTTSESSGSSTSESSGGDDDESSTGGVSTTMMTTTGMTSLDDTGPGSSEDTNDPTGNGMQPADGMYSDCLDAEPCGFNPNLCITIQDADMMNIDGFCSTTGCANPAMDCDPSPGGTAVPICMPTTVNNMMLQACALSCAGGMTCPLPMMCYNLNGIGEICA